MRTLFIFFVLCACLQGRCQLILSVNSGYGSYNMADMKTFQNQIASSFPVKPSTDPSFPSYWFFDINAKTVFKNHFLLGASLASGSTGGRVYYSDYSGSIGSDQLLSFQSYHVTLGFQHKFFSGHLVLEGDLRPGITATDLKLKSYVDVAGYAESNTEYKSNNFVLQPTLTLGGRFGLIGLQGFAGYNVSVITGKLNEVGTPGYLQANGQNSVACANWSGLRVGGGLSLYINDGSKAKAENENARWTTSTGLGLGLDYGGIGLNVLTYPGKYVGMFVGAGYAIAGVGYNAGLKIRTKDVSSDKTSLYFTGMYGYNAAIAVTNQADYNRFFYGATLGMGVDFAKRTSGYWSLGLLLPIRSDEVDQYINNLNSMGVKLRTSLTPVTFSIGYRFQKKTVGN